MEKVLAATGISQLREVQRESRELQFVESCFDSNAPIGRN